MSEKAIDIVVDLFHNIVKVFVRKYIRRKANGTVDTYLGIVRSYRQGKKVYQQHICRLGRLDELQASGQIDKLMRGLSRFSQRMWVVADESPVTDKE